MYLLAAGLWKARQPARGDLPAARQVTRELSKQSRAS